MDIDLELLSNEIIEKPNLCFKKNFTIFQKLQAK